MFIKDLLLVVKNHDKPSVAIAYWRIYAFLIFQTIITVKVLEGNLEYF